MRMRHTPAPESRASNFPGGDAGFGAGGMRLAGRRSVCPAARRRGAFAFLPLLFVLAAGATPNPPSPPPGNLPDVGLSLLRVLGALALVLAVFFGGVWLFRNWQRLAVRRGRAPRLNVLEVRSLGGRHALYVVGYDQERFLLASSPGGVHLVSHLQNAGAESPEEALAPQVSFARALTQMLKARSPSLGGTGEVK